MPRLLRKSRTSSPSRAKKIRVFSLLSSKTRFIISTCPSKSSTISIYLSFGYRFPHIPPCTCSHRLHYYIRVISGSVSEPLRSMITTVEGDSSVIARVTSIPSLSGSAGSTNMMSGFKALNFSIASLPLFEVPTTSKSSFSYVVASMMHISANSDIDAFHGIKN